MKKVYTVLNLVVLLGVIVWNYVSSTKGINGNLVGDLSDAYMNFFTPAGYAFSIWGVIYLGLLAQGIFQVKRVFVDRKNDDFVLKIGPWLILANVANAVWLWFWLTEQTGVSVLVMLVILASLLLTVTRLGMGRSEAAKVVKGWVWGPVQLYAGWITVATVANVSAYLAKIGWVAVFSEEVWAVVMLAVAALLNVAVVFSRGMRVFAGVGIWAIVAIAVRHWGTVPLLQWTAVACAAVIAGSIVLRSLGRPRA